MEQTNEHEFGDQSQMVQTMSAKTELLKGYSYRRSVQARQLEFLKTAGFRFSKQFAKSVAMKKTSRRVYGRKYIPDLEPISEVDKEDIEELDQGDEAGPSHSGDINIESDEYDEYEDDERFGWEKVWNTLTTIPEEDGDEMNRDTMGVGGEVNETWEIKMKEELSKMTVYRTSVEFHLNSIPEEDDNWVKKEDLYLAEEEVDLEQVNKRKSFYGIMMLEGLEKVDKVGKNDNGEEHDSKVKKNKRELYKEVVQTTLKHFFGKEAEVNGKQVNEEETQIKKGYEGNVCAGPSCAENKSGNAKTDFNLHNWKNIPEEDGEEFLEVEHTSL